MTAQQRKADPAYDIIVQHTRDVLGISHEQAEKRVDALYDSGILFQFSGPDDPKGQIAIDLFLQIPR